MAKKNQTQESLELLKEFRKQNDSIDKKLDYIKQEVELSNIDTALLSGIFFFVGFYFVLLLSKDYILSLIKIPVAFVVFISFLPFITTMLTASICIILCYFIKEIRFYGRLIALMSIIFGFLNVISFVIIWLLILIFSITNKTFIKVLLILFVLVSLLTCAYLNPKIITFLRKRAPDL
jgi:hypothetical protein